MSNQPILAKRFKQHDGLSELATNYIHYPLPSQNLPAVFRYSEGDTSNSGGIPALQSWVGGTTISGAGLHTAFDQYTQRNDVLFFHNRIWTWFDNNIWAYDTLWDGNSSPQHGTWAIHSTPTTQTLPHLGMYAVVLSGQGVLATCAFEGTSVARQVIYNPWTNITDSGTTSTYGGPAQATVREGVHTEIEFNNKIWWVMSDGSDVNVWTPEKKTINVLDLPSNIEFPMDLCPFEGKMYMLANTTESGSIIFEVDEVAGVTPKVYIPGTDGSGNNTLSFKDDYTRNSLFVTTDSGHNTGTTIADRWPLGNPGDSIKTPHMVAHICMTTADTGLTYAGYGTYCIINDGDRFNHILNVAPAIHSRHPFPFGGFWNAPFQQGEGNVEQVLVDDMSYKSITAGGNEVAYYNYRSWTIAGRDVYFPHSKDGSFRENYDYRGPKTHAQFWDGPFGSGASSATSFPKVYAGGHRFHAPEQLSINISGVLQGAENGIENDNVQINFTIRNNEQAPNGTPISVRVYYSEFNGAAMKGTGILENPSHGVIYDQTRLDIPAVDSGTVYSVEWNNKAVHFRDTEWLQFGIFVGISGQIP